MKENMYKKYALAIVLLLVVVGISFFAKKREISEIQPLQPPIVNGDEVVTPEKTEDKGEGEVSKALIYQDLIKVGHESYKKSNYSEALIYFKKAVVIEQNSSIYRSLYSAYMGLKDYKNAEISIKKSVELSQEIPNNWIEYASFENYYMKAPFNVVSKIYLDALQATKNNINIITSYASYLAENKKYNEAIFYLEKAIIVDPTRKDIYQKEIDYLRVK